MPRRNPQQPLIILVVAVVFVGSLLMIFVRQPEQLVAVSPDGLLTVEGLARETGGMTIQTLDAASRHYVLAIDRFRTIEDVTISFSANDVAEHNASMLVFDRDANAWTSQLFVYDAQREQFVLYLERLPSTELRVVIPAVNGSVDNENLLY